MREILFRGKRKDNGEWVYGYLYRLSERLNPFIMFVNSSAESHEVIPETVAQFTGLTDKNGQKIFEGDLLRGFCYPFQDGNGNYNYYAEVVWFKNSPAFGLVTHKNPKSNVVGISDGNCEYIEDWDNCHWEIIGNVYDNPELEEE